MSSSLRILIVDDSPIVREGLKALLATDTGLEVVGEAGDGDTALRAAADLAPDIVLLDVRMPGRDGLSVVRELASEATVVMLTFSDERHVISEALASGARGYLVHGTFDAQSLGHMIRSTVAGSGSFSGPALQVLLDGPVAPLPEQVDRSELGLSERQAEVMGLIAQGLSNRAIAKELFVAEKTVKNHINQIFAVLGVASRSEAIVRWLNPDARG